MPAQDIDQGAAEPASRPGHGDAVSGTHLSGGRRLRQPLAVLPRVVVGPAGASRPLPPIPVVAVPGNGSGQPGAEVDTRPPAERGQPSAGHRVTPVVACSI